MNDTREPNEAKHSPLAHKIARLWHQNEETEDARVSAVNGLAAFIDAEIEPMVAALQHLVICASEDRPDEDWACALNRARVALANTKDGA